MGHEDEGLQRDLARLASLIDRRSMLRMVASAVALPVVACATDDSDTAMLGDSGDPDSGSRDTGDSAPQTCDAIPEETAGPYPGDGSNGPNALALSGIVRSDIRPNLTSSGSAEGVLLKVRLTIVSNGSCGSLAGYAVYLWHCDRDGNYSMYTAADATYLRGVQVTDEDGVVEFTTIYPGCYDGRWPHIHFEVYENLDATSSARNVVATSQLAMPEDVCETVYAEDGYETSVQNLAQASLQGDNVFGDDGGVQQIPTVSGSVADGYVARLWVPV